MPEPADRTPSLRDQIAEAIREGAPSDDNRPSYRTADAVLPVIEAETAALRDRAKRADDRAEAAGYEATSARLDLREALDQIAAERRARLAAEAAVRRACELADRAEMTADVIDPDGTRIQFAAVAVRDLRPALAIKQPKETR